MNGIHDLGGMHGFGRVEARPEPSPFHEAWEGRVHAMLGFVLGAGVASVDAFRHSIERLDAVTYLTAGYYGRWLRALETLCVEAGVTTRAELSRRHTELVAGDPLSPASAWTPPTGSPDPGAGYRRAVAEAARFQEGERVRARNLHPAGHTRLPGYVRGRTGVVHRVRGGFVFPDTNAHGQGEQPQHLYTVRFDASTLWGPEAEARGAVYADLFESYLEKT